MMDLQESLHTASSICDRGRRLDLNFYSLLNCTLQVALCTGNENAFKINL